MYQFEKTEEKDVCYKFQTKNNFLYEVYFVNAPFYFPDYQSFKHEVYEFVVKLSESNININPPFDIDLAETIAKIFHDFFQNHEKVAVYSCDTTDGKQFARHRKFSNWFDKFNDSNFLKYDSKIEDFENESTYFMSIIFQITNPHKIEIKKAFDELTNSLSSKPNN